MSRMRDDLDRVDSITRGITRILASQGTGGLTMRAIARSVGLSTGTLNGHLSNRTRILRVCGYRFGRRRLDDLATRVAQEGVTAFLAHNDEQVQLTRVGLAWRELARDDPSLAAAVAEFDAEERWMLAEVLAAASDNQLPIVRPWSDPAQRIAALTSNPRLEEPVLDALAALVLGLRDLACCRADPMPPDRAQRALASAVAWARARSSATMASGSDAE